METELRGTSKGLAVNLRQGNQTRFYRLSIQSLPGLLKYYDQHAAELTELKHRELGDALEELFGNWETHHRHGRSESTLLKLRNQIGLNAVVGGLGYHLVAVVGNATYRCVYERDRRLYFLLPPNTRQFELVGRKLADDSILFPGRYSVKVARRGNARPDS